MNIPVFLSSDNNYAPFVATTMASILDNTKSFVEFYVLDGGISEENKEKISSLKKCFNNFDVEFIEVDIKKFIAPNIYKNSAGHVSLSTYNRFLIPKIKPEFEKICYFDVDIIFQDDVLNLYNIDMSSYPIAAVEEPTVGVGLTQIKEAINFNPSSIYFNAGVIVVNNKLWVQEGMFEKLMKTFDENREKIQYADQDVLNIFFENKTKILPNRFNSRYMLNIPYIMHYAGKIKPWYINPKYNNEEIRLFWKYAKMTPFYDVLLSKTLDEVSQEEIIRQFRVQEIKKKVAQPLIKEKI